MADAETPAPASDDLAPPSHLELAGAKADAASKLAAEAKQHVQDHLDASHPEDHSGGGAAEGDRSFPGSAQTRGAWHGNTGAARSYRSMTGR
jgi:hypothetical protein